jgi:hypothetical protein
MSFRVFPIGKCYKTFKRVFLNRIDGYILHNSEKKMNFISGKDHNYGLNQHKC